MKTEGLTDVQEKRKRMYKEVVEAFEDKYSWLGRQAAREMLMSVATWNLEKHSDPPFRYRTHVMLAWERGYLKSTIMRKMARVLGDEFCSVIGKVSDAAIRGSVSGKKFSPPKPLRTPIVISTEFGQTDFEGELLNIFLDLLEEGHTNVALNKIAALPDKQKKAIEGKYDGEIEFNEENEFDLHTDFVFWGATYDPTKLEDDALRSRFNVVTPAAPLDSSITWTADNNPDVLSQISTDTVQSLRRELWSEKEFSTDFRPPKSMYEKHNIIPRESRDIQSYMAARNWWGLSTNPEVMEDYIKHLKESRRRASMSPKERVVDLIFDNPMTYEELKERTGLEYQDLHSILQSVNADRFDVEDTPKWVIWSGAPKGGK